ncbi:MFS transporter [Arenibacterium sp. LLYu02]|uniref:MFS transporter n=1 Tax=Arenibacterium sp. LLYu02 TaxID=3404132 RepID=UPI003B223540
MMILSPLKNRAFANLWLSYSASSAATALLPTTLTLLILDWDSGLSALAIALSARTIGFLAGALVGGQIADRYPRLAVLSGTSALRSLAVLAIATCFADMLWALAVCLLLAGAGEGGFRSAYQAAMADMVPAGLRQGANALTTLSARIAQIAGPLLAVAVYAALGAMVSLCLAAAFWALSASLVWILRASVAAPNSGTDAGEDIGLQATLKRQKGEALGGGGMTAGFWAAWGEGLNEARRHRWFLAGLTALLVWLGLGNSVQQLLLPVISREHLGGDAFLGYALGAYSFGALCGGILLGTINLRRPGMIAFIGLALYGLVPLALFSQSVPLILLAYTLVGSASRCSTFPGSPRCRTKSRGTRSVASPPSTLSSPTGHRPWLWLRCR